TDADEVAGLISQLRDGNWKENLSAAQRLAIFRDPEAAPALAERLTGSRREVRVAVAIALAACGTRESVPPLLEALTDSDPLVAQAAAMALENLTGHTRPFDAFASTRRREQQAAQWRDWFTATGWPQIEAELIGRIASEDRDVVRRAAVALGHTGSPAARDALRRYVDRERNVNPYPEWKKTHQVDGTRFNAMADVNPRTLQAVARAIGYLQDADAVTLLAETLAQHNHPDTGNLFLAEACVEALGRIGTPDAETALIDAFAALDDYPKYTLWYGDHPALMACHASPVHYFIVAALDKLGSTGARKILPDLILSLPVDQDRALLLGNDDCEQLIGRVIRRHGAERTVVETCLAILGDASATRDATFEQAIATTHRCWGGHPGPEIRAAQVLSLVCRDAEYAPRILAAFDRYRAQPVSIDRVFDQGIPVVLELPLKNWVCFYLGRALGNLADPRTAGPLTAVLEQSPPEAASGHPDPLGPGVLFLHNDLTPCWRAAVAWALGEIGDRRAVPVLLAIVSDLSNAPDTRHTAAEALGKIADPSDAAAIQQLADGYPEESTRRALLAAIAD
ncbi:MAG: HEAT repeat domain-containing protein, partial [Planctomycetes bacterium]|nr:HEAT repeat domain-containing protein [Planctomycetota bacterium]